MGISKIVDQLKNLLSLNNRSLIFQVSKIIDHPPQFFLYRPQCYFIWLAIWLKYIQT